MDIKKEPLKNLLEAEASLLYPAKWILTALVFIIVVTSFLFGMYTSSHSYDYRYPTEYNWWIDHERLHLPGVAISTAMVNTSCKQQGNVHPPYGKNVTQIQFLGGWDSGFIGNLKIESDDGEIIVPAPDVGYCIYITDASQNLTVYGQDISSGGWTRLGRR